MITGDIKNKVDQIWDIFWTAGITNPITILEQMTYLFFMKMIDDSQLRQEKTANIFGNKLSNPTFPEGEWLNPEDGPSTGSGQAQPVRYADMRWHTFRDFSADNMFAIVQKSVFPFIRQIGSGEASAYARYMKNAIFLIPNARTLQRVVDEIDSLPMDKRDAMGDVYEYILGKMAASGTNGQFRTPRHIIAMMVSLMEPRLGDRICDPAMGSAGFIVESARYITEHERDRLRTDKAAKDVFNNQTFFGFDTDQTMLRIGAMNMMLHDVTNPHIAWRDSLSSDNEDEDDYSLILANPPFAGSLDYEQVNKKILALAKTKKTELLFISQFIRSLEPGGRCASIVPDGVLFGSSTAHKAIRKELVDGQCLRAVISMPSGVFKPYAGVSTAILIFTKTNSGGTDRVWFYDMKADGFSLDDKRQPIAANDIPDIIARFHNLAAEADRTRKDQSFFVPADEIRANDYDLSINKYKEVEREVVHYDAPEVIFAQIEAIEADVQQRMERLRGMLKDNG